MPAAAPYHGSKAYVLMKSEGSVQGAGGASVRGVEVLRTESLRAVASMSTMAGAVPAMSPSP
jgi:hypothetical protein